jgi:hypothetical protein
MMAICNTLLTPRCPLGDHIREKLVNIVISEYLGLTPLAKLPIQPCTDQIITELTARGRKFEQIAIGKNYVDYFGNAFFDYGQRREEPRGISQFKADGRVMIAPQLMEEAYPEYGGGADDSWEYRCAPNHCTVNCSFRS